jgi:hypothetical protein
LVDQEAPQGRFYRVLKRKLERHDDRSWFFGNYVVQGTCSIKRRPLSFILVPDGHLYVVYPVHPVFLLLSFMDIYQVGLGSALFTD